MTTSVPAGNQPRILPIRAAFEMRQPVDIAQARCRLPIGSRYVPCTLALCLAVRQTREAIDIRVATTLVLEVAFSMARMVPMSRRAFGEATGGGPD